MAFLSAGRPLIALPAAGASERMRGADKLLQTLDGKTLLHRQVARALATGCPVVVTLPALDHPRHDALSDLTVEFVAVPSARAGMSASLRAAAHATAPDQPLMILLPDVPGIETAHLQKVIAAFENAGGDRIVQATDARGRPGTPVIFPARYLPAFDDLTGDGGARALFASEDVLQVALPGDAATRDLDTPEDWAAWRAENGQAD